MKKILLISVTSLCLFFFACEDKDFLVPVTGKVVDKVTKLPVIKARVVYNAVETVETDNFGEFRLNYNLKSFLADSINFYISKDKYKDRDYSNIVGNTQKDIYLVELEPK